MTRSLAIALVVLASISIKRARAQEHEPDNGPELVKVLEEKYGVISLLNRDSLIYLVGIEDNADIPKAVDRVIKIPSVEQVSFHWERDRKHVNGAAIRKLGQLPKLSLFDARFCDIHDDDAAGLEALKNLTHLRLDGNPITDRALIHLKPMKKLELLYLTSTKVHGPGFKNLKSLPRLRNLYLSFTPITDESINTLSEVQTLQVLDMHNTKVTNKGIMQLTGLYLLHNLVIDGKVSDEFMRAHAAARAAAEKKGLVPKNHPQLGVY